MCRHVESQKMNILLSIAFCLFVVVQDGDAWGRRKGLEECSSDQFECRNFRNECPRKEKTCNGYPDCSDWTDEENCSPTKCEADEFVCRNYKRRCLSKNETCNGDQACPDWSDEENCPLKNCTDDQFRCKNGMCIAKSNKCNKLNDCEDWSDEENCSETECGYWDFKCGTGRCIRYGYQCNALNDCGDWSDEECSYKCGDWAWKSYRGSCYYVGGTFEKVTWLESRRICQSDGGYLASVTIPRDEEFLSSLFYGTIKTAYIGLKKDYKQVRKGDIFRWDDGLPLTYQHWQGGEPNGGGSERCVMMDGVHGWKDVFCGERLTNQYICMKSAKIHEFWGFPKERSSTAHVRYRTTLPALAHGDENNLLRPCKSGELASTFRFCDGQTDCRDGSDEMECDDECDGFEYRCNNGICISYSFYCDGVDDCEDRSDEERCRRKPCSDEDWACGNGQCIEKSKTCDFQFDCSDGSDEDNCEICRGFVCYDGSCIPSSWVGDGHVDCEGYEAEDESDDSRRIGLHDDANNPDCTYEPGSFGKMRFRFPDNETECTATECTEEYYKCPGSYCIPVSHVCNGHKDCPNEEDEDFCNAFICRGYYRCDGETNCIHPSQVCDEKVHCPKGDDEFYCPQPCPPFCTCYGRVITCSGNITSWTSIPSDVRKLNLSGSEILISLENMRYLHYLAVIILSHCDISDIHGLLQEQPNLIELDVSNNKIRNISRSSLSGFTRLRKLDLSSNVFLNHIEKGAFADLKLLESLNLGNTRVGDLTDASLGELPKLQILILANSGITKIEGSPFSSMTVLHELDISQNDLEQFSCCFLNDLPSLEKLSAQSARLCCDSMRPRSLNRDKCLAFDSSAISSCSDLIGTKTIRAMLWLIALFALFGNISVLVYRFKYDRASLKRSYGIFVTNLSISDCLMGLYMLIIGCADAAYRGTYVSGEYGWRHGGTCKFAGFLSTVSSEASCIFISFITLDRFLAIKYPFGQVRFSRRITIVSVLIAWCVSIGISVIPLLPALSQWKLFSKNSVCLALPLSSERSPGWQYSSVIFIGFNFILFLFIGLGQILIFKELKSSSRIRGTSDTDGKVARKLFLVVFTDFLCWFPVGVMGILALKGFPIGKEVYAWTAVTVLPVNSALNPILYTLPSMIQTWREANKVRQGVDEAVILAHPPPDHPAVKHAKKYVGRPSDDMETLQTTLESPDMTSDTRCALLALIITYIYELNHDDRRFEAVTDKNIFVRKDKEKILCICLFLKEDPYRYWLVDDVLYLSQLTRKRNAEVTEDEVTVDEENCILSPQPIRQQNDQDFCGRTAGQEINIQWESSSYTDKRTVHQRYTCKGGVKFHSFHNDLTTETL